jgi:hypothetical protein
MATGGLVVLVQENNNTKDNNRRLSFFIERNYLGCKNN